MKPIKCKEKVDGIILFSTILNNFNSTEPPQKRQRISS